MPHDISATGLSVTISSSVTFPAGFTLTSFADDADPLDIPDKIIAEVAMNINGELISWSTPTPNLVTLNLIAGSEDAVNLGYILDANTARKGGLHVGDLITMVVVYPDGVKAIARNGKLLSGPVGISAASSGRKKSAVFQFAFQDFDAVRV